MPHGSLRLHNRILTQTIQKSRKVDKTMAFCTNSSWTIDMYRDDPQLTLPPVFLDRLFFQLAISAGTITGDVFINGVRISGVDGTCQDDAALNAAAMRLKFTWVTVDILMTGVVYVEVGTNRFKGRFVAFPPAVAPTVAIKQLALLVPEVGETGTGNGMQT